MGWVGDVLEFFRKIIKDDVPKALIESRDKKRLKELLNDPKWADGRSIGALAKGIGQDETATRKLLHEIGATRFDLRKGGEGWRLPRS